MFSKFQTSEQTQRRLVSLMDQIGLAGVNFAGFVVFARLLSIAEFGILATAMAIWYFFEAMQRAAVIIPMITTVTHPAEQPGDCGAWFLFNCLIAALSCVGLILLWGILQSYSEQLSLMLLTSASLVPSCMLFFFLRRFLYQLQKYKAAFLTMLVFVFLYVSGLSVFLYLNIDMTVWLAVLAFTCPHILSSLMILWLVRKNLNYDKNAVRFLRSHIHTIFEMGGGGIATYFSNNGIQLVLGFVSGPIQAGIFAATRILTRPLLIFMIAINDTERSKATKLYATEGEGALNKFILNIGFYISVILGPVLCLLYIYAQDILHFVLDEKYSAYQAEAQLWVFALLPQILCLPLDIFYTTLGRSRLLLVLKVISALISLGVILICMVFTHFTVWEGILSILLGRLFLGVSLLYFYLTRQTQDQLMR